MSKAVLIMEMPENCFKCPIAKMSVRFFGVLCNANNRRNEKMFQKPDWCPLRDMPEKKQYEQLPDGSKLKAWGNGWNECLEEIIGDEE